MSINLGHKPYFKIFQKSKESSVATEMFRCIKI